jgi:hypothetical protein
MCIPAIYSPDGLTLVEISNGLKPAFCKIKYPPVTTNINRNKKRITIEYNEGGKVSG